MTKLEQMCESENSHYRSNKLELAARALLAHWDTPAWKYLKPTGDLMADLREALAEPDIEEMTLTQIAARHEQAEQEPVAWMYEGDTYFDGKIDRFVWQYTGSKELAEFKSGTIKKPIPLYAAPVSIEAAVLAEREACAKVCDEIFSKCVDDFEAGAADECAAAIRARGEK